MNLIEEAVVIELFGIKMYAFGVYVAFGTLFAVIVIGVAGRILSLKQGTAPLTACLSILFGFLCARFAFCLLNRELGHTTPLFFWPQVNGGGWSMFGLVGGVFAGGLVSAWIMKEKAWTVSDLLSLAILPLIAAERIGENRIEDFDISRPLDSTFLNGTFLAVGEDEPCLATYYVAAAVAVVLFAFLAFLLTRVQKEGNLTIMFLLLFGAASIITESLRYDRYLSVSFVGLQQIAAACMLALGVVLAVWRYNRLKSALSIIALVSIPAVIGIVIGLEFALDRTTWNKLLVYAGMIITVMIPVTAGIKMLSKRNEGNEAE